MAWSKFQTDPDIVVIGLRGPSGAGKTLTGMNLASANGLPFAKFEVPAMRDFSDWFGTVSLKETDTGKVVTEFTPSDFCEAIRLDGPYAGLPRLILLDEFNRAETQSAMNALLAVTDGSGSVYIPDARKSIVVDPAVMWVVTLNIGAGFTGTGTLDRALANRVTDWINVDYPTLQVEVEIVSEQAAITQQVASPLVRVATQLRAMANRGEIPEGVSTRQLVRIGKAVKHGLSAAEAYEVGFANNAAFSREGGADSDFDRIMVPVNQALR
jgi:MoxR-like ATPase